METTQLTTSDPRILAEFISPDDMKAFWEQRFEAPPDYMGLLMRNGQFVEAYKGTQLTVGGLFHQVKALVGARRRSA